MTTPWTRGHVSGLSTEGRSTAVFEAEVARRSVPNWFLWDPWPVRTSDGALAEVRGEELWIALSAPTTTDPLERHDIARLRLLARRGDEFTDLGDLLGDAATGSRQWAGSALFHPEEGRLELFYTAAGRRNETSPTFVQRIMRASGRLADDSLRFAEWIHLGELVGPGRVYHSTANQLEGVPGFIKAFRDPFPFDNGHEQGLLFAATMRESETEFNGAVGLATGPSLTSLTPRPPLITADGVNNELERPHLVRRGGLIYLFFSTQSATFHPKSPGPTGLFGFVSDRTDGDWQPLNGSGLVLTNPPEEPLQAYSWLVLNDLRVVSFVDYYGLGGQRRGTDRASTEFVGAIAPYERIELKGDTSSLLTRP